MCKDRLRSVKWSKHHPSPPHHILTTARVGPYGYIHTIYIRRYGTKITTLTPWILHPTRVTKPWAHQTTDPQTHRLTIGTLAHHLHLGTPWAYWLTIGSLAHHLHPGTWHSIVSPSHWFLGLGSYHLATLKPVKRQLALGR